MVELADLGEKILAEWVDQIKSRGAQAVLILREPEDDACAWRYSNNGVGVSVPDICDICGDVYAGLTGAPGTTVLSIE